MSVEVRVDGLRELRASLRKIDPELQKELRQAFVPIAERVAATARAAVPVRTGRARSSIRSGVSGSKVWVAGGKKAAPYFGWLDFGTRTPVRGLPRRVGPWAKSGRGPRDGRFLYPAIAKQRTSIQRDALRAMEEAKRRVF